MLCNLRPGPERRRKGAFYTPPTIVHPMVDWVLKQSPARVIDPGCGSGRFSAEIIRHEPGLEVWALDLDPLQTLITRAALAVLGACHAHVLQADYLEVDLPASPGRTAFVSNPPYVRHHDLTPTAKAWGATAARKLGHTFFGLAGLHAHFFLATAHLGRPGDVGCFVTSAEWLDVGYGSVIRSLLLNGLGGQALHVVEPSTAAFDDAQTTAVITCFRFGSTPEVVRVRRVSSRDELCQLEDGHPVPRAEFANAGRWTPLTRNPEAVDDSLRPLGELVEVHRGMVTGANDYFVLTRERAAALGILPWCVPVVSDGREILESNGLVRDGAERKMLLRVPRDIDRGAFPALDAYLHLGEAPVGDPRAISNRYISSHRRPWWYMGSQQAPPIMASYMARQAPVFALNPDGLALLNIAHGLYPKKPMTLAQLHGLVAHLNKVRDSFRGQGRTYQGGLEKFEPREMEALQIAFAATAGADNG
ncbi:MAG: N-6 DNA methylase [Chloroflexota bacterium]